MFFSTFGGNPVSVAAAHAVLDVLEDERVLPRTAAAGRALRAAVSAAAARFPCVGHVRGVGLANAVELVADRATKAPDGALAGRVKAALRARGVLVGTTGEHDNILKIRPPLAFTEAEVPLFVEALVGALEEATAAAAAAGRPLLVPKRMEREQPAAPAEEEEPAASVVMMAASSRL